ncbi:MAG: FAD-dependent oxidoreductase [Gammaproteobacteria bacterium]|nr:FAD-dependent oxidoreductase [Gammaproteobacteria bacterium]
MKRLFHPSLYEFDKPQPSYWEASAGNSDLHCEPLAGTQSCDVAIIGGGYTGLSAALHLARDFNVDVDELEAGHIGWGASGRNGGFCTTGATKLSLKSQLAKFGVDETRHFYQSQDDAVNLVRSLGEDKNIDFLAQGDGEFMVAESTKHFDELKKHAEIERQLLGLDISIHSRDEFREIGYDAPHQHGAVQHRPSFGLHPLHHTRPRGGGARPRRAHTRAQ